MKGSHPDFRPEGHPGVPVTIEGYVLTYLPRGTNLTGWSDQATAAVVSAHPRVRAVVHTTLSRPVVMLLLWPAGWDVGAVEERVMQSRYTDEDFATCVSAYVGTQRCCSCGTSSSTLLPDAGMPPSSPARWRRHPIQRRCPSCGAESLAYLELLPEPNRPDPA